MVDNSSLYDGLVCNCVYSYPLTTARSYTPNGKSFTNVNIIVVSVNDVNDCDVPFNITLGSPPSVNFSPVIVISGNVPILLICGVIELIMYLLIVASVIFMVIV